MRARLGSDQSGTASVEFAMAGTTVLVLLLATFDLGTLFVAKRGLDHGVNRAARWAAVNSGSLSVANVLTQFQSTAGALLPNASTCLGYAAGATVPATTRCAVIVTAPSGTAVGSNVTVQATYKWSPVGAITGLTAATLQSTATLAVQN